MSIASSVWEAATTKFRGRPAEARAAADESPPIVVRRMDFGFEDLPRHWFDNDPFLTQLVNGLHFVFPAGERFFIRGVRSFYRDLPAEHKAAAAAFFGQEAEHQREHLAAFAAIEAQGFRVSDFIEWYERVAYGDIEKRFTPKARLAATVALEHYTAVLGEFALRSPQLRTCHPRMRDLLLWHAAEEVEHKSVAFDVLKEVDPSYALRMRGFALGTVALFFFWGAGVRHMLAQEPLRDRLPTRRTLELLLSPEFRGAVARWFDFLKPDFHPNDHDNYHLAKEYLEEIGRLTH